ncbi:MAG: response regulator [Rhodospirillaceae bacterium]|nr:response regulator [Rhodospirillaceae bacterium]
MIDDDQSILDLVKCVLERKGHTISVLSNPDKALKVAHLSKPDFVVCDFNFKGFDLTGLHVAGLLRNEGFKVGIFSANLDIADEVMGAGFPFCYKVATINDIRDFAEEIAAQNTVASVAKI